MQTVERWVTRSDAWTQQDDERLAALVLHHIRTGSTQLRAFEEAANELGRTAAACGYRWNGVVRKDYREDIEAAKQVRKSAQKSAPAETPVKAVEVPATPASSSESIKDVITFLQVFDEQYQKLRQQVESLEQERDALKSRVADLESQLSAPVEQPALPVTPAQLEEDSKALFAIMERARKLLQGDPQKTRAD